MSENATKYSTEGEAARVLVRNGYTRENYGLWIKNGMAPVKIKLDSGDQKYFISRLS